MCRSNDFTSTTAHVVLFPSCFWQCCHRKLAASCSHALDSVTPMRFVVVGHAANPDFCGTALHAWALVFWVESIFWVSMQKTNKISDWKCGRRGLHRIARKCAGIGGRCSVWKNMSTQRLPPHVGFIERLWNTLVSSSLPGRLRLRGFHCCACKQPAFFESSIWTVAHKGGTLPCRIFRECLRTL